MARPTKEGLDYFPLDVIMDDKIELIEAKHGITGFGIVVKLYQEIYKNGYYIQLTEDKKLLFKRKINVDINIINDVINDCIVWGIFDESIHKKYGVLTSRGVQKRYIDATQRRKDVELIAEYLVIDDINQDNVHIIEKFADDKKQSKVKESKVKEKESKVYGELAHVRLTDDEYQKLIDTFGQAITDQYIEKVDLYIGTNGKQYKSHYAAIRQWINRDKENGKIGKKKQSGNQFLDMLEQEEANGQERDNSDISGY